MDVLDFILPISAALIITIIHFIGERLSIRLRSWRDYVESGGAGLMVGILFLELLPLIFVGESELETIIGENLVEITIFMPFLAGFTIIALLEKIVYRRFLIDNPVTHPKIHAHADTNFEEHEDIKMVEYDQELVDIECVIPEHMALFEGIALVVHSFVIGILISLIFYDEPWQLALLIMIPFFIRAFTIAFSAEQIMEEIEDKKEKILRIFSLLAPTLGATIGIFLRLNIIVFYIFYAFALGFIFFIIIRDMIPLGKKGKPLMFFLGIMITITIFLLFELAF